VNLLTKRKLGNTGIEVFPIAFGGISIQRISKEEAVKVVRRAIDLGIDLIDTARGYTDSEIKIGGAIKGTDKKIYLASKSGTRSKEGTFQDINISLKNLRVGRIDIYPYNFPIPDLVEENTSFLEKIIEEIRGS
jgi:aryl-alcohol dehydrogenase-like predicted oxidoreductase